MPYDGSGNFIRTFPPGGWQGDATANIKIRADRHDQHDQDLANGLSNCITKDGQTQIAANISWNSRKITNLANPTAAQDAATKAYADSIRAFASSLTISGADANGRLTFSSLTGTNGIAWTGADFAWLARQDVTNQTRDRLVLNDKADGSGNDVAVLDDLGNLGISSLTWNLSNDVSGVWRTPAPGYGGRLAWSGNGSELVLQGMETATIGGSYLPAAGLGAVNVKLNANGGDSTIVLTKSATAAKSNVIHGYRGTAPRWSMFLGNAGDESGSSAGSDFYIIGYGDGGTSFTSLNILRSDHRVYFPSGIGGPVTFSGAVTVNDLVKAEGYYERNGTTGVYGTDIFNSWYVSASDIRCYVNTSFVGTWTPVCDHRIKREVAPLPGTWDAVKALRPVTFKDAAWGGEGSVFKDGEDLRAGFLAHELQEALGPWAASGTKDGEDLQAPNVLAIIAALTNSLQEAMLRIEALEARLAA